MENRRDRPHNGALFPFSIRKSNRRGFKSLANILSRPGDSLVKSLQEEQRKLVKNLKEVLSRSR